MFRSCRKTLRPRQHRGDRIWPCVRASSTGYPRERKSGNDELLTSDMRTTTAQSVCPACSVTGEFVLAVPGGFSLMRCSSCGLVFHNEFASETELLGYYAGYYDSENLAFSPITEKRFADLLRSFEAYRRQNNILDVGCGSGHFLKVSME